MESRNTTKHKDYRMLLLLPRLYKSESIVTARREEDTE